MADAEHAWGAVGLPAGTGGHGCQLLSLAPERAQLNSLNEMRVPGGETLYDREVRLQRLRAPAPA